MAKNGFAAKLQELLRQSNVKHATLAGAVQYDLSYISKWLSGKMLPSEKNIDEVIEKIADCLMQGNREALAESCGCDAAALRGRLLDELHRAYEDGRPKKIEEHFQAVQPIHEVVEDIDRKVWNSKKVLAVVDLFSMPHENRLALAGIRNGRFVSKPSDMEYSMVICADSTDCVYDAIFLIHMLTSMSDLKFKLYNTKKAYGKILYCMDDQTVSAFVFPEQKSCIAVNELINRKEIGQSLGALIDQENLIFRKTTVAEMIRGRDYIQTMISSNIRWILGHATELLLPQDVFSELMAADDRDTSEYSRIYGLSQKVAGAASSRIMVYESAIAHLAVDGIIDFYNRPVALTPGQVVRCLNYYKDLVKRGSQIRIIDGGFSDDFRYITNPCMFLSDSICYVRLENNRYEDNILVLKDKSVKEIFERFFSAVWTGRRDVVTEDGAQIIRKIDRYIESAEILMAAGQPHSAL